MDLIFHLLIRAFFGRGELTRVPLRTLSFGFGMVLENTRFVTYYKIFEKLFVIFDAFKNVQAHIPSVFLLFFGEFFWNQLCTNFLPAQFLGQNALNCLAIQNQLTTDHSDCKTSIRQHDSPYIGHIFFRF